VAGRALRSYSLLLGSCQLEDEDLLVALDCLPQVKPVGMFNFFDIL
jgi:hypothetical protein